MMNDKFLSLSLSFSNKKKKNKMIEEEDVPRGIGGWEVFDYDYHFEEVVFNRTKQIGGHTLAAVFFANDVESKGFWICKVALGDGPWLFVITANDERDDPKLFIRRVLEKEIPERLEAITGFSETIHRVIESLDRDYWRCAACGKETHDGIADSSFEHFITEHYNKTSVKSARKIS